jgi:hypothetical protein
MTTDVHQIADYAELEAKLAGCAAEPRTDPESSGQVDITIPMPYRVALCA